ncbi:arsenite methyltransferase [Seleniivibrio woodruffii]|uniref:arsenite methyltransferase n=1 Tax=Seleniivibrio woodruffii TaxID=1078050 RepID=UPI00240A5A3E|nr:arsenite methyltransferase [Seleniivibrio woodruffii]
MKRETVKFGMRNKVRDYYGKIAVQVQKKESFGSLACCGGERKLTQIYDKSKLGELPENAVEASLGCADPIRFAELKEGETVLDLGSGGGINVFMAAKHVGESGMVYGLDMTDEMLELAERNRKTMGSGNVRFIKGFIEDIPLEDKTVDVIISNCVINLSDSKERVASEAYRVLKSGGRLAIADIISLKEVSAEMREAAAAWCGCLGGTISAAEYSDILRSAGFENIEVRTEHVYTGEILEEYFLKDRYLSDTIDRKYLDEADGAFAGAFIKAVKP